MRGTTTVEFMGAGSSTRPNLQWKDLLQIETSRLAGEGATLHVPTDDMVACHPGAPYEAHLPTGLFHGENGSHGVAISSAVSTIASTNSPHMRVRGPGLVTQLRQAAADHCQCPRAADSHSAGAMTVLVQQALA